MLKPILAFSTIFAMLAPAHAKTPRVVTDIAPIYSLVLQVMGNSDDLTLLMDQTADPHDFAFRPSQASALQGADIVIFTGYDLTPWLEKPLQNLATNSVLLPLLDAPKTIHLDMREDNAFGHETSHEHHHTDPHAWLDPENAIYWLEQIYINISALDPENNTKYKNNAMIAQQNIRTLSAEIKQQLVPIKDTKILFFHDAYQYFESRFKLNAVGAITLADGSKLSPKQLKAVQSLFTDHDIDCVLTEPATKTAWINDLARRPVKQASLDPLGSTLPLDKQFYSALLTNTANQITSCTRP